MVRRSGELPALFSLGERLVLKPNFDQLKTSRSFYGTAFQVGPLWLPPFFLLESSYSQQIGLALKRLYAFVKKLKSIFETHVL